MSCFNTEAVMEMIRKNIKDSDLSISDRYLITPYYTKRIEECKQFSNIVIFGAGNFSKHLLKMLRLEGLDEAIRCFCDNDVMKEGLYIDGLEILLPSNAYERYPEACFLISANNYENEIFRQLSRLGITSDKVIFFDAVKANIAGEMM